MSDFEKIFAAIDQLVASPSEQDCVGQILSQMEDATHWPGGLVALADHYGDREEAEAAEEGGGSEEKNWNVRERTTNGGR